MRLLLSLLATVLLGLPVVQAQVTGYYRQPALSGDHLIFNAEGDLWTVARHGGAAQRLTSHPGQEGWPVVSPDGQWVAFSASYEGAADTYVMPRRGGTPRRLSWDGARPVGWTPEGHVIARTRAYAGLPDVRLVTIDPATSAVTQVPLAQAAEAAMAEDGTLFFARLPRQSSNARWYKGGYAQNLWKFAPGAPEAVPLTADYPGASRQPTLLADGRLYFLSDRVGAMNIWSMTPEGTDLQQHTHGTDWDIQELTGDGTRLAYRLGADLWTFDPATGQNAQVPITLVTDIERSLVDWETNPWPYLSDLALAADGAQVALVARGELFVAPVGSGRLVHASRDAGVRYRNVVFGADSTHVLALSDKSGELEWWRVPVNGVGSPVQVTDGPGMLRQDGLVSPDGRYLLHGARYNGLWLVDLTKGTSTKIVDFPSGGFAWSPDGKYVVYAASTPNQMTALYAYEVAEQTHTQLTSDRFMDRSPVFSADGNWLFFVSTRTWNSSVGSPWGERAPQPHFENTAKIYALPLREGLTFPHTPPHELTAASAKAEAASGPRRWDLGHLLREVPVPAGSYGRLMTNEKRLFYVARVDGDAHLMALDLQPQAEPVQLVEDIAHAELSAAGAHLLVRKGQKLHVISAGAGKDAALNAKNAVPLDGWHFAVDKRAEWTQIYHDMWRLHRDYFWDPDMHGVDWTAMRDKYAVLLDRVGSREALADLQAMLVSELSLLHSSAGGGDIQQGEDQVAPASLGGVFVREATTGGFRLVHRYEADPDLPGEWSPLAHPDVQIREGSIILAVNGQPTQTAPSLGALLMGQAGQQVLLAVQDPDGHTRSVVATPSSGRAAFNLRYHEWEHTRRLMADSLSGGKVGYVHLRAMGRNDIGQWTREFYSQTDKQGLILDVRHNNGGNIDSWVLSQLLRRAWAYFQARDGSPPTPNMQYSYNGHLVILVDERTASDGEAVADGFRRLGLGQAIGTRTWGGEVWLTSSNRQVDGGIARASEFGVYGPEQAWLIEGWGFVPDIVVDNLPHATFNGRDAQLEAAVAHLEALIQEDPRRPPAPPPYPVLIPGSGFPTPWHDGQ